MKLGHKGYKHPLCEVFGYAVDDFSPEADRHRRNRLCPYNNKVPNCTKDKANDPLGVCSMFEDGTQTTIICPVRFRQNWQITDDAASFFFPKGQKWTSLIEVRLNDKFGKSAGNIDVVLVSYNDRGHVTDFGSLAVQGVYISGNIRRLFEQYMKSPKHNYNLDWSMGKYPPHPDYLSSSRKRLLPQLMYKGGILKAWKKKQAVAIHENFFNTLPKFPAVSEDKGEIAWMIYDLQCNESKNTFALKKKKTIYTRFDTAIKKITTTKAGDIKGFVKVLQDKLDEKLSGSSPDTPILSDIMREEE